MKKKLDFAPTMTNEIQRKKLASGIMKNARMKNLRLVFDDMEETRRDFTLPMEQWIDDWFIECDFVPSNDTVIYEAELDGKSILSEIKARDKENVEFMEIAEHFEWERIFDKTRI